MLYINVLVEESEMSLQEVIDHINKLKVVRLEINDEDQDLYTQEKES